MTNILEYLNSLTEEEIDNVNVDDVVIQLMKESEIDYDKLHYFLNV